MTVFKSWIFSASVIKIVFITHELSSHLIHHTDIRVSLVTFGFLTPITVVNLVSSRWTQRISVDRRDQIRVGTLFMLFIFQYAITSLNNEEKKFIWKILKAVGCGSMAYIILGDKKKKNDLKFKKYL